MKQRTAKNIDQVRTWIETQQHHFADASSETHVILSGRDERLRIPKEIWQKCFIEVGSHLDARMYRWDHDAEFAKVWNGKAK